MNKHAKMTWLAAAFLFTGASSVQASTTYDLTSGGSPATQIGSGFGNALDFGDMTVTAWATTGVPQGTNSLLDTAQVLRFGTGLGVCNRQETTNCYNPLHQVDNIGDDDLVLFAFDQQVQFDEIIIDPFGVYDRDVTFWVADLADFDIKGLNSVDLDSGASVFGTPTDVSNSASSAPIAIDLGGNVGNALLFAPRFDASNKKDNDRFKISALTTTTVVPVPAAVWLFGSGLIGLVAVARRRRIS